MKLLLDDHRLLFGLGACLTGLVVLAGSAFAPLVDPQPQAGPGDAETTVSSDRSPIRIITIAGLPEFTERPLFKAGRRPFVSPEPQQTPITTQNAPPRFSLAGTMGRADGTRWAYVTTENAVVRAEVGETVEDWIVTAIEEDRVLIRRNGIEFQIQSSGTRPPGSAAPENSDQGAGRNNPARTRQRRTRSN